MGDAVKRFARARRLAAPLLLLAFALAAFAAADLLRRRAAARAAASAPAWETADLTPDVAAVTILLGGFRGLAADWLWSRADTLQENGRYFELAQLSAWIARLQPRSPSIWVYHAWNLSYNLAACAPDAASRWRWVAEGIRLLREDAMEFCPRSAAVHRELAWIYLHKLGSADDPFSPAYRRFWAAEASANPPPSPLFPDPAVASEIDALLPGLDWTSPQAAAFYWARAGRPFARTPGEDVALRRIEYQALFQLVEQGRADYLPVAVALVRAAAAAHPSNPSLQSLLARLSP